MQKNFKLKTTTAVLIILLTITFALIISYLVLEQNFLFEQFFEVKETFFDFQQKIIIQENENLNFKISEISQKCSELKSNQEDRDALTWENISKEIVDRGLKRYWLTLYLLFTTYVRPALFRMF